MRFRTKELTELKKDADAGSGWVDVLLENALVRTWSQANDAESPAEELSNGFVFVKVETGGLTGWVEEGRLKIETPDPVSEAGFVLQCLRIETVLNDLSKVDPWFVSADFIIARALAETGMQNLNTPIEGSDGIGPLRVTSVEWRMFLSDLGSERGYREADREFWFFQPWAALYRMHTDGKALSEHIAGVRKLSNRGALPTFRASSVDLSLLRLLGTQEGMKVVVAKDAGQGATPLNAVLAGRDGLRDAAIRANAAILADGNISIDTIYANIERQMDGKLVEAAALIARHSPENLIVPPSGLEDDDGPNPNSNLNIPDPGNLDWSGANRSRPTRTEKIVALYGAFRRAGFSDSGSRALIAEVGRENSLDPNLMFGSHTDPANGAVNGGIFSWQGARAAKLTQKLKAEGLTGANGKMQRSQAALDAQAVFVDGELAASHPDIRRYVTDPDIKLDYDKAARLLGRDYLRWRFDDPLYARGHQNRRDFLEITHQAVQNRIPDSESVGNDHDFNITRSDKGFYQCAGLKYDLAGKTRRRPVSKVCVLKIMTAAAKTDAALRVIITSAGQDPLGQGTRRTGSTRHDVKKATLEGETADLVLVRAGKIVAPPDDMALYETFLEHAAATGFSGIGHYGWGVHVGDGTKAAWGPTRSGASLNPRLGKAIRRGWSRAGI